MISRIFYIFFFIICLCNGKAQDVSPLFPTQFALDHHAYTSINPAFQCFQHTMEITVLHQGYSNDWKGLNASYVSFSNVLAGKSALGVGFYNEREGYYLSRNRGNMAYSYKTNITKKWRASAGLRIGFASYAISGTASTGSAAAFVPDAAAGILVSNQKLLYAASVAQLFNNQMTPVNESFHLKRYYSLLGQVKLVDTDKIRLLFTTQYSKPFYAHYSYHAGCDVIFRNSLYTGFGYRRFTGLSFSAGLWEFVWNSFRTNVLVSYLKPVMKSDLSLVKYELGILVGSLLNHKKDFK